MFTCTHSHKQYLSSVFSAWWTHIWQVKNATFLYQKFQDLFFLKKFTNLRPTPIQNLVKGKTSICKRFSNWYKCLSWLWWCICNWCLRWRCESVESTFGFTCVSKTTRAIHWPWQPSVLENVYRGFARQPCFYGRNNRLFFPAEQIFFLMQIIFIVLPSNMAAVQNLYSVS